MRENLRRALAPLLCLALAASLLCGCGGDAVSVSSSPVPGAASPAQTPAPTATPAPTPEPTPARDSTPQVLEPSAPGAETYGNASVTIDCSNTADGYFMANYAGSSPKVRMLVNGPDGVQYKFALNGGWETFPLSAGAGSYQINVYESAGGNEYYPLYGVTVNAPVKDEFATFLRPNQFVRYDADTAAVAAAAELAQGAETDLEVVDRVYNYVLEHVDYDYGKAEVASRGSVQNFLPDVDETLASGGGICFDYAAVMATMLRTQRIPTRLDIGWAGDIYHAWVSVYVDDVGWINGIIQFDGHEWKRMDPTFADNGNQEEWIMDFIATDSNYNVLLVY